MERREVTAMERRKRSTAAREAFRAGRTADGVRMIHDAVQRASAWVEPVRCAIGRAVVGQERVVERLMIALLANGHVLLEGAPGLAKTLAVRTLATATGASFRRIRFSSDSEPADIHRAEAPDPRTPSAPGRKGPFLANFILADGINRAPARAQAVLLEAMRDGHVAVGPEVSPLPDPFLAVATVNPVAEEGTSPLPASETDRFLMKVVVPFPSLTEERMILDLADSEAPRVPAVVQAKEIREARALTQAIYVEERLKDYVVSLVYATREPMGFGVDLDARIRHGASPRATLGLVAAARARAFLGGRGAVMHEDVMAVAIDVLRHRVAVTYEGEAEGLTSEDIVRRILDAVAVP